MHRLERFHRLEFRQHGVVYDNIGPVVLIERHILINHWQRDFPPDVHPIPLPRTVPQIALRIPLP